MKKMILLLLVIVVGVSGYFFMNKRSSGDLQKPSAHPTSEIMRGDISSIITGRGKTMAKRRVMLQSTLDGRIEELLVKEGEEVEKGVCLVKIGLKAEQKMRFLDLKRRILANDYEKNELQKQLEFQRELQEEGLAAQMQMASLKEKVRWKETEIVILDNERELLGKQFGIDLTSDKLLRSQISQIDNGCVYSPIHGTVVQINIDVDDMVSSMAGGNAGPIMVLADSSSYYVDFKVNELDLDKVKKDQDVQIIFDAFPEEDFKGEIEKIETFAFLDMSPGSFMDPSKETSQYKTKIRILQSSPKLRPGLSCRVSIKTETRSNVLLTPITSVFTEPGGGDYVMVSHPNGAEQTEVRVGIADFQMVEILSGVSEMEQVFLNPYELIEERTIMKADQSRTIVEKILQ